MKRKNFKWQDGIKNIIDGVDIEQEERLQKKLKLKKSKEKTMQKKSEPKKVKETKVQKKSEPKEVRFIKFKKDGFSTMRIKRGFEKEFTLEKEQDGWILYTKAKNGNWAKLKSFKSADDGMKWMARYIDQINMHDKDGLAEVLKKRVG